MKLGHIWHETSDLVTPSVVNQTDSFINSGLQQLSDLAGGNSFGDILMVSDPMLKGSFKVVKLRLLASCLSIGSRQEG